MPYRTLVYEPEKEEIISVRDDILRESPIRKNKKSILFVSHQHPHSIGGIQKHSRRLYDGLKDDYNITRANCMNFGSLFSTMLGYGNGNGRGNGKFDIKASSLMYCDAGISAILGPTLLGRKVGAAAATVHGLDIIAPIPSYQKIVARGLQKLDRVVCVSKATAREVAKRGVIRDKIVVIPNAARKTDRLIEKDEKLYERLKELLKIDLRGKRVLFSLGRPVKRKGFDHFGRDVFPYFSDDYVYIVAGPKLQVPAWLKICRMILSRKLDHGLRLAMGYHTSHNELLELSKHPRFFYINNIDCELKNLLFAVSDLFILPNIKVEGDMEGFGIVALEAASRGIPVIASDIEGIIDAVVEGQNGYRVKHGDNYGMYRAIDELLNNRSNLEYLKANAREFTLREFSLEKVIGLYRRMFEDLFEEKANAKRNNDFSK
ncbi:MAG: glycosyltransferase [candidate division Zixibacteria bacterium]|nr:glycosyltransferase [candidate division Zixibacteria bacterium]